MTVIGKGINTAALEYFNQGYPEINKLVYLHGDKQESRVGLTTEILNFKTYISNPINRLVGGYKRNMNVFFLLAEAIWILNGRRDVEFLSIFNSRMTLS